jgi:outer membrane lipoprotein-sorting protein
MPAMAMAASPSPIDDLMLALARVPEARSRFIETKSIAALSEPLTATGTLYYRRPSHLEKITAPPHPEQLVVDGDQLALKEGDKAARVVDLGSQPRLRALVDAIRGTLSGDLALLQRWYRVEMTGSTAAWTLTLTPIDAGVASLIKFIVIQGSGASLRAMRTVQANGDDSRMTIDPLP